MRDSVVVDLASGTCAGISQLLVGHPFDTVKVRMQVAQAGSASSTAMGAARSVVAAHGPLGLYHGMAAPLLTVAAFNATLFGAWGAAERVLSPEGVPLTVGQAMLAGGVAGVPVSLLATPTELLKCRLQAQGGAKPLPGVVYSPAEVRAGRALFNGPWGVLRHVVRHEGGLLALYRGATATLLREVPGNAAYFGVYEGLKHWLARWQGVAVSELGPVSLMASGGLGGAAFWLCTFPADVIKTKMQTQSAFAADRYRGTLDCARRLLQAEGWPALWRGIEPALARSVPANAVAFLVFEEVRAWASSAAF